MTWLECGLYRSIICVIWPWEKDGITASFPKAWRALIMSSFYSQLFYYIRMSSCEAMILKWHPVAKIIFLPKKIFPKKNSWLLIWLCAIRVVNTPMGSFRLGFWFGSGYNRCLRFYSAVKVLVQFQRKQKYFFLVRKEQIRFRIGSESFENPFSFH